MAKKQDGRKGSVERARLAMIAARDRGDAEEYRVQRARYEIAKQAAAKKKAR
jgi:hypothetical protein